MHRKFDKKRQPNRGFTLVELVIVIAILAILVGLLAPQYTRYIERTRKTADADNLEEMVKAFQVAVADHEGNVPSGTYTIAMTGSDKGVTTFEGPDSSEIKNKNDTTYGELYTQMCATLGDNWLDTSMKSSNWGVDSIFATIDVGSDGSVSVDYNPTGLKELVLKSTTITVKPEE